MYTTDEVKDFYQNYRDSLERQYQTANQSLDQQRKNAQATIMSGANKAGMLYSSFVPREKIKYDAETYTPMSTYEEARIIRVNKQQIAIPMTWFFKMKDMTIYEQWDFLRAYRLDMPYKLKTKICLDDALSKAYDLGMETDFLNMFYDMERDDPKEFKRRKNLLASKKNKVKSSMKTCLCEINKLRATTDGSWPELFDELYVEYSSGRMFGTLNFTEYCEFSVRSDEKYHSVLEEAQRIHSVAWYISMITDDYISLDEELQELEKQREFEADLYSFGS